MFNTFMLKFSMFLNTPTWVTTLKNATTKVLNPILIIACLAGIIYAIWVGITFAKAEDANSRKEAKTKLITVIVGIVASIALIVLFYWFAWMIEKGKIDFDFLNEQDSGFIQEHNVDYTITFPAGVTVTFVSARDGDQNPSHNANDTLSSGSKLHYGDVISITITGDSEYNYINGDSSYSLGGGNITCKGDIIITVAA